MKSGRLAPGTSRTGGRAVCRFAHNGRSRRPAPNCFAQDVASQHRQHRVAVDKSEGQELVLADGLAPLPPRWRRQPGRGAQKGNSREPPSGCPRGAKWAPVSDLAQAPSNPYEQTSRMWHDTTRRGTNRLPLKSLRPPLGVVRKKCSGNCQKDASRAAPLTTPLFTTLLVTQSGGEKDQTPSGAAGARRALAFRSLRIEL